MAKNRQSGSSKRQSFHKIDWPSILLASSLPLLLVLASLSMVWDDPNQYESSFRQNPIGYDRCVDITDKIFAYIKSPMSTQLSIPEFNDREISHMRDVKIALKGASNTMWSLALIWAITFFISRKTFSKALFLGGIAGLALSITLAILPFQWLFGAFHQVLFTQGSWIFSHTDLIINVYPIDLFASLGIQILIRFLALIGISIAVGYFLSTKSWD